MSDLVEFLAARLDEDEQAANAAAKEVAESLVPLGFLEDQPDEHLALAMRWQAKVWLFSRQAFADLGRWGTKELATWGADHIARHDPTRVLAEVAAKRQIMAEHPSMFRDIGWLDDDRDEAYEELEVCARCVSKHSHFATRADVPTGPCRTVRLLALPYAAHPDYQQEWAL